VLKGHLSIKFPKPVLKKIYFELRKLVEIILNLKFVSFHKTRSNLKIQKTTTH